MVLLLVIETAVVGTLIASYFYLRIGQTDWAPAGVAPPDLLLPTVNSLILFSSSIPMYLADAAIKKGNQKRLLRGIIGALVLGTIFLILKMVECLATTRRPTRLRRA
jgi:cytochrome c oxidase subunit 3